MAGGFFLSFFVHFCVWFRTSIFAEFYCILAVNMGPTWPHFRSPKRFGMPSKMRMVFNALLDTSWHRFLEDFGRPKASFLDENRVEFGKDI